MWQNDGSPAASEQEDAHASGAQNVPSMEIWTSASHQAGDTLYGCDCDWRRDASTICSPW